MRFAKNSLGLLLSVLLAQVLPSRGAADVWVSPRSQGMGGCSVSQPDGAEGVLENPALLAELGLTELLAGYDRRCGSGEPIHFTTATARPFDFGGLGFGYQRNREGCWEDALTVSYGRFLPFYIASLGLNGKLLYLTPSEGPTVDCSQRRNALSFGLGFLFRFLSLSLGYVHHNLVVKELAGEERNGEGPEATKALGLSYRHPEWARWSLQTSSLAGIGDELQLGTEVRFGRGVRGRMGIDRGKPTAGIGCEGSQWVLDASVLIDSELGNTYAASFKWRMGRRFLFE